jgi:hypothetical protein
MRDGNFRTKHFLCSECDNEYTLEELSTKPRLARKRVCVYCEDSSPDAVSIRERTLSGPIEGVFIDEMEPARLHALQGNW